MTIPTADTVPHPATGDPMIGCQLIGHDIRDTMPAGIAASLICAHGPAAEIMLEIRTDDDVDGDRPGTKLTLDPAAAGQLIAELADALAAMAPAR